MRTIIVAAILAVTGQAFAGPVLPVGCPNCLLNTASPQDAQVNIGTAVIRGTLTVSTLSVTNLVMTNLTATQFVGGGAGLTSLNASALASGTASSSVVTGNYYGITGLGIISSGTWNAGKIGTQYGGSGQNWSTVNQGALPYFSGTGAMSTLAAGTVNYVLQAGGASANPSWTNAPTVLGTNVTAIPLANLSTGNLPSGIKATDASLVTVTGSKVSGNISGNAANITGTLALSSLAAGAFSTANPASSVTATGVTPIVCGGATQLCQVNVHSDGRVYAAAQSSISIPTSGLQNGTLPAGVTIAAAGVNPGALGTSVIASSIAANGVVPGTYGGALQSAQIAVGLDGRVTSATQFIIPSVSTRTAWTDQDNDWHGAAQTSVSTWTFANNVGIGGSLTAGSFSVGGSTLVVTAGTTTVNRLQLITPLSMSYGGTSASDGPSGLSNLGGAKSGVNADITVLQGLNRVTSSFTMASSSITANGILNTASEIIASTLTILGNAFSVGGSSFTVGGGSATVAYGLTVGGQMTASVGTFTSRVNIGTGTENPYGAIAYVNGTVVAQSTSTTEGSSVFEIRDASGPVTAKFMQGSGDGSIIYQGYNTLGASSLVIRKGGNFNTAGTITSFGLTDTGGITVAGNSVLGKNAVNSSGAVLFSSGMAIIQSTSPTVASVIFEVREASGTPSLQILQGSPSQNGNILKVLNNLGGTTFSVNENGNTSIVGALTQTGPVTMGSSLGVTGATYLAGGITASSGTFTATGPTQYSITASSGISALFFKGDGTQITGIVASTALALASQGTSAGSGKFALGVDTAGNALLGTTDATTNGLSGSTAPWSSGAAYTSLASLGGAASVPTRQSFLSGSGTYNRPAGVRQIEGEECAGGGGGGGNSAYGLDGGATYFSSFVASHGIGGVGGNGGYSNYVLGPAGGSGGSGGGWVIAAGNAGGVSNPANYAFSGQGGGSGFWGGAGPGCSGTCANGGAGGANTGGGGGGACNGANCGSGGTGGECKKFFIDSPASSYSYGVGNGGAGGTGGNTGGPGGSGAIYIKEIY